ncbi:MAG: hypothetical protein NVSMB29_02720 [Candidatus Dormibacteria bacterium]
MALLRERKPQPNALPAGSSPMPATSQRGRGGQQSPDRRVDWASLSSVEAKVSTATDEQVAVIRRGWMGTAVTVAPGVTGLTDFMEDRLVELESRGELTENDLLAVVEAAAQMVLASGSADQARDTSRRMRRTVYEFLLALDASSTEETVEDRNGGGLAVSEVDDPDGAADEEARAPAWEGVGRRRPVSPHDAPHAEDTGRDGKLSPGRVAPRAGFHLTDPVDLGEPPALTHPVGLAQPLEVAEPAGFAEPAEVAEPVEAAAPIEAADPGEVAALIGAAEVVDAAEAVDAAEPAESSKPAGVGQAAGASVVTPAEPPANPDDGFAAPSDRLAPGEHMAEPEFSTLPAPVEPGEDGQARAHPDDAALPAEARMEPPAGDHFEELITPASPPPRAPALQTPAAWTAKFTEAAQPATSREEPSLVPDVWAEDGDLDEAGGGSHNLLGDPEAAYRNLPITDDDADEATTSSWRVRKPELAGEGGRRGSSGDLRPDSWQSADDDTEPEPDLSASRWEIDELLRRKKYDQTGAILQQLAQDTGGRAVAELALDIGDRCRAMGKRMAATSCYLAASRADPVFEEPLARLADVCIDDRDVDLAVSYLERIARLTRATGDVKGALRVYRKIHAIAPHRDDILDLLMRAQTTGRLDP